MDNVSHTNEENITPHGEEVNDSCPVTITAEEWMTFQASLQNLQTGILVSYLVTMSVGLVGNSLVIYIIARNAQIRNKSVANYYIWNLAFADLFFVLMMPLFCYATYFNDWPFGIAVCKLSRVFFETNRYASMFTLVALSFDRYLASFYHLSHLRTVRSGIIVCCVIWAMCATISIPYWIYATVTKRQCTVEFPSWFMTFWTFFQLALALIIPLIMICVSYVLLTLRLQMVLKTSSARSASVQRPSRKMLRTVLVVVVIFLICQVPWHAQEIINLNRHIKYHYNDCLPTIPEMKLAMYLNMISIILGFISSCCNPIIYGILNNNYRKQYASAMCCCCYNNRLSVNGAHNPFRPSAGAGSQKVWRFHLAFHTFCCKQRKSSSRPNTEENCKLNNTVTTERAELQDKSYIVGRI